MLKRLSVMVLTAFFAVGMRACFAQSEKPVLSFEQLFPAPLQYQMGLHKLSKREKELLQMHVEKLLIQCITTLRSTGPATARGSVSGIYTGTGGRHWIRENIGRGSYILLEDGSLWQVDPLDKIDAMLWLPVSNITVVRSNSGSPGYDYLLINTDDGEKAHAKYVGRQ